MGISNLGSKLSDSDKNKVAGIMNPPEMDPEFSGGGGDSSGDSSGFDDFGDIFDDISDMGGFLGGDASSGDTGGQSSANSLGQFGQLATNGTQTGLTPGITPGIGSGQLNIPGVTQPQPIQYQDTPVDLAFKASGEAAKSFYGILLEMIKSIRTRNADDLGFFARNLILTGAGMAICGLVVLIIGTATQLSFLSIKGLPLEIITAGII